VGALARDSLRPAAKVGANALAALSLSELGSLFPSIHISRVSLSSLHISSEEVKYLPFASTFAQSVAWGGAFYDVCCYTPPRWAVFSSYLQNFTQ
jgi:hypothetical protein